MASQFLPINTIDVWWDNTCIGIPLIPLSFFNGGWCVCFLWCSQSLKKMLAFPNFSFFLFHCVASLHFQQVNYFSVYLSEPLVLGYSIRFHLLFVKSLKKGKLLISPCTSALDHLTQDVQHLIYSLYGLCISVVFLTPFRCRFGIKVQLCLWL